jgi:hypothetical protein
MLEPMKLSIAAITVALSVTTIALAGPASAAVAMHGDPVVGAENWSKQNYDDCTLMATAHLIGFFTGDTPDEEGIIAMAGQTLSGEGHGPIYVKPANLDDPNTGDGAATTDMPALMAKYGLKAVYTDDEVAKGSGMATGMPALEGYLDTSGAVLAVADADIIWNQPGKNYGPHAVMVIGVDTANGIVHLNDSGPEDGADEQVPIGQFEKAWGTYDHQLVIAVD